jgi:hypothetical protein
LNLRTVALPFDWIRINITDLINILESNFQFFLDNLYIERESNKFQLFDSEIIIKNYDLIINQENELKTLIIKSKRYPSLVFPHEIKDSKDMPQFIEKYKRRINNYINTCTNTNINIKKIFIRIDKKPLTLEEKNLLEKTLNISNEITNEISNEITNEIRYITMDKKYESWKKDEIDWISIFQ